MARMVFFSFDYDDVWRVNIVRNSDITKKTIDEAGYIDKAEFEKIEKKGDDAVRKWIDDQLKGTSVTAVLIGAKTSESKWVRYEINHSVTKNNSLLGIYVHNIKDASGKRGIKGKDPFVALGYGGIKTYDWIEDNGYFNLADWVEQAYLEAQFN